MKNTCRQTAQVQQCIQQMNKSWVLVSNHPSMRNLLRESCALVRRAVCNGPTDSQTLTLARLDSQNMLMQHKCE